MTKNKSRSRTEYVLEHELRQAEKCYNSVRERLRQSGSLDYSEVKRLKEQYGSLKKQIDDLREALGRA